MKPLAEEWVAKAEGDYRVARDQWPTAEPVYDAICFHAQQCVEKYLKAWLAEHDADFPRIHDLEALAKLCVPSLPVDENTLDALRLLTNYAVEVRYPGLVATEEDARKCWQAAEQARGWLRSHLGLD